MNEENNEIMEVEQQNVPAPAMQNMAVVDLEKSIEEAEKYMTLQDKIRKIAIKVTNSNDWVDQGGKPYLTWDGSRKIARAFGVSYEPPTIKEDRREDKKGEYIKFTCSGAVTYCGQVVHEIGTASTRDSFFAKRKGKQLPLEDIDLTNIEKKSMTNWLNRAVKSLLGLSFTWEEIKQYSGVQQASAASVNYQGGQKGGSTAKQDDPKVAQMRQELRDMILDYCGGDIDMAINYLANMSKSKGPGGKEIPGKENVDHLTATQVKKLHPTVKAEYEEWKASEGGEE